VPPPLDILCEAQQTAPPRYLHGYPILRVSPSSLFSLVNIKLGSGALPLDIFIEAQETALRGAMKSLKGAWLPDLVTLLQSRLALLLEEKRTSEDVDVYNAGRLPRFLRMTELLVQVIYTLINA